MTLIDRILTSQQAVLLLVVGSSLLMGCGSKNVDATPDVVQKLKNEDPLVRRIALAEVADSKTFTTEVVDVISDMVRNDESADVRAAAVRSLRNSWSEGVDALPLLNEVAQTEQSPIVKFEINRAMKYITDVKLGNIPPE